MGPKIRSGGSISCRPAWIISTMRNTTVGHTPVEILGDPTLRSEVAENLEQAAASRQGPVDKLESELSEGDSVRVALTSDQVRKARLREVGWTPALVQPSVYGP